MSKRTTTSCDRCDGSGLVAAWRGQALGCSWDEFVRRRRAVLDMERAEVERVGLRLYRKMRAELMRHRSRFSTTTCPDCGGAGHGEREEIVQVGPVVEDERENENGAETIPDAVFWERDD